MKLAAKALFFLALAHAAQAELTVRFLAERIPEGVNEVVMLTEKKMSEAFKPPTKHLSAEMKPPAREFELRTSTEERRLIGKVQLPEEGESFIILLLPQPEAGFRSVVLRSDEPGFVPGDCYLYNDTSNRVVGYIGEKRFQLKPGGGSSIRPIEKPGKGFHDVGFGVDVIVGEEIRVLSMTRWPVDHQVRSYVFFFDNERTKRVDYRAIDEFIPDIKPASPGDK